MGYAGGDSADPTYHSIGDHTECFQVDFDSTVVSYEALLERALDLHDPTRPAFKVQYASLVLAHDDAQLATARAVAKRVETRLGRRLATRIEPLKCFNLAEDYHQKYHLRNDRVLMKDFRAMLPDDVGLRESPAAARANGYVAGDGTRTQLAAEIDLLGLSEAGRACLLSRVLGDTFSGGCSV